MGPARRSRRISLQDPRSYKGALFRQMLPELTQYFQRTSLSWTRQHTICLLLKPARHVLLNFLMPALADLANGPDQRNLAILSLFFDPSFGDSFKKTRSQ